MTPIYANRFKLVSLLFLVLLLMNCGKKLPAEIKEEKQEETAQQANNITTYAAPAALPAGYRSQLYVVTAGGLAVDLYHAGNNSWNNPVSYGYFDIAGTATITVHPDFSFSSFQVLPTSLAISATESGGTIRFTLNDPTNVSIVFDNNYQGKALHLFARKPETDIPDSNDPDVLYYGPGFYNLEGQAPVAIASNKTVYIAGGAVVRGRLMSNNTSNVTVRGRGILMNDYLSQDSYNDIALSLGNVTQAKVEDIIVNRNANSWTASMYQCSFVDVKNYIVISPWFASSDGFNMVSSHDITFDSVFIRTADDAIAIKGMSDQDPPDAPAIYNITYEHAQLWADANNTIGIGAETKASSFYNIHFRDIDVLYNFDDRDHPDVLPDRSAINIFALHGTSIHDVSFENIRVEKAKRLINIEMDDSFYFGAISGDWSWPGAIYNIHYKNITSTSDGSNEIKLAAWDYAHPIYGVTFENVQINGNELSDFSDSHLRINGFTHDVLIKTNATTVKGNDYAAANDLGTVQGGRNWYCRTWAAGVGTQEMVWNSDGSNHWRGPNNWDAIWKDGVAVGLHPDNNQVMLEWQATHDGTIAIEGVVKKIATDGGDGVNVSIWQNNTMIWPATGTWYTVPFDDAIGVDTNVGVAVQAGDVISFRVDQRIDSAYDSTAWNPSITYE